MNNIIEQSKQLLQKSQEAICTIDKEHKEINMKNIAKSYNIDLLDLKNELKRRVTLYPSLKAVEDCDDFVEDIAFQIAQKKKISLSTRQIPSQVVVDDDSEYISQIIVKAKQGKEIDAIELGRAILKASGINY